MMTSSQRQKRNVLIVAVISMILYGVFVVLKTSPFETKWEYVEYNDGYKLVSYKQGINDKKENIVVPAHYEGKDVVAVGDRAFYRNNHIRMVIIPDTVEELGSSVFKECRNLVTVTLGEHLRVMGGECFKNCKSLLFVDLPESLTEIRGETFMGCTDLRNIELPENITEIKGYTFEGCSALEYIEIPRGVTRIAAHAFYGCYSLTGVFVPDTVKEIGSSAFRRCNSLEKIELPEGVSINERAFKESPTRILKKQISDKLFDDIKTEIDNTTSFDTVYVLCDKNKGQDEYLIENNTIALINDIRFEELMGEEYEMRKFADSQELVEYLNKAKELNVENVKWFLYSNVASEELGYTYFVPCEQSIDVVVEAQTDFIEQNGSGIINKPETYEVVQDVTIDFKTSE